MSKKIRPVFEDAGVEIEKNNQIDNKQDSSQVIEEQDSSQQSSVDYVKQQKVGPRSLTNEMIDKLEKFDSIVDQNKLLLAEKDELMNKIAEYISEVDKLKTQINCAENQKCTDEKQSNDDMLAENSQLKNDNKKLQESYDALLVRISDLSFENAKLTCQLQEISKKMPNQQRRMNISNSQTNGGVANKIPLFNSGYSSWN